MILKGVRQDEWGKGIDAFLTISSSQGVSDLDTPETYTVSISAVLDLASREKVLRLPINSDEDDLLRLVDRWPGSLRAFGLQISTGPVVPFRATAFLDKAGQVPESHVPLLWMNHVQAMQVSWPIGKHKPEYIKHETASLPLLVPNRNYVLLRRFSAKEEDRRLVAGPYLARSHETPRVGLENHLNYIYRPGGNLTEDETFGLAALFSSSLLDAYFRTSNGNTQVSATELRMIPLPPLEAITAIGRTVRNGKRDIETIDRLVEHHAGLVQENKKVGAYG